MADSLYFPEVGSKTRYLRRIQGKVTFGSTAIGTSSVRGGTVTRTAAGTYTLTADENFAGVSSASIVFNVVSTTPVDLTPQLYDISTSAKTIKFKLLTGVTATDPATGTEMYVEFGLKDSEVEY